MDGCTAIRGLVCVFTLLCTRNAAIAAEGDIVDVGGIPIPKHSVSGCFAQYSYELRCNSGLIAPFRYIYTLRAPDVQQSAQCSMCIDAWNSCFMPCCTENPAKDCRLETEPYVYVNMYTRLMDVAYKPQSAGAVRFGRTALLTSELGCAEYGHRTSRLYSQSAIFEFFCIEGDWEVTFGGSSDSTKAGSALFIRLSDMFDDQQKGYNISCSLVAETGNTIVIRAVDLRLCTSEHNTNTCGQEFRIVDGNTAGFGPITRTPNSDQGYLGFKTLYTTATNSVTLKLDSSRQTADTFNLWLYVKPSNGIITAHCKALQYFTTTTTTTTTTTSPTPKTSTAAFAVVHWAPSSPPDGATVLACVGQEAVLEWNYTLVAGEQVEDIRWLVSDGRSIQMIAVFTYNNFAVMPSYSGRVRHLGNARLALNHVIMQDKGHYSVDMSVHRANGTFAIGHRSVHLEVAAPPAARSGELAVNQDRPAVHNNVTGDRNMTLTCGMFSDLGQPPVDVLWKTPNGTSLPSSHYDNGYFELVLDNPVERGNYSCRLNTSSPAAVCFHIDDPMMQEVRVTVD